MPADIPPATVPGKLLATVDFDAVLVLIHERLASPVEERAILRDWLMALATGSSDRPTCTKTRKEDQ
ncbi:MAG: hypothetical protein L0241_10625 [Planctomycetia bacterium]|nr:hypothetical protein [Planctomycetia bacterium]